MPYSSFNQANITASTKTANILSGDVNEFPTSDSVVNIYAVTSASGVRITMSVDNEVVIDDKEIINIGTTLDKSAHLQDSFEIAGGSRLSLTLRETAGAATTDVLLGVEVL